MTAMSSFYKTQKNIAQTIFVSSIVLMVIALTATTTSFVSVWAANLIGTSGPDTLEGTDEDDFIDGRGGDDIISDGLGSDEILGGRDDDMIELEGTGDSSTDTNNQDVADGQRGDDNIVSDAENGFIVIHGGADDDTIRGIQGNGRIYGDSGNDRVITHDAVFDVWGGSGNDEIDGQSECLIPHAYGEAGNDRIIYAGRFASGGPGNDFIRFDDCRGVAYGDAGNDELRASAEHPGELHGGS